MRAKWVVAGMVVLMAVTRCQVFYETDDEYYPDRKSIDFGADPFTSPCYCDLTKAACDVNCKCDGDCTDIEKMIDLYGFDYKGNQIDLMTNCYEMGKDTTGILWKINKKWGMNIYSPSSTSTCVEVSDSTVLSNPVTDTKSIDPSTAVGNTNGNNNNFNEVSDADLKATNGYQMSDFIVTKDSLILPDNYASCTVSTDSMIIRPLRFGIRSIYLCNINIPSPTSCTKDTFFNIQNVQMINNIQIG